MNVAVIMALRLTLLCFCLLFCVHSLKKQITSPIVPLFIDHAAAPLFSTSLNIESIVYPIIRWTFGQWIFITELTDPASYIGNIHYPDLSVYWYGGNVCFEPVGNEPSVPSSLPLGKWVHLTMGADGSESYALVTIRGEVTAELSSVIPENLAPESVYIGSSDTTSFTVRR